MLTRRSSLVYGALLLIWSALIGWQVAEHFHFRRAARDELRRSAKDISNTLALLMRQQRFFGFFVRRDRLETVLNELVTNQVDLRSIVLLDATNDERAFAGAPLDPRLKEDLLKQKEELGLKATQAIEDWDDKDQIVGLMNLAMLGTNLVTDPDHLPPRRMSTNT